jgi:hypothetical protein
MIASLFQSTEIWRSVGHLINESELFTTNGAATYRHVPTQFAPCIRHSPPTDRNYIS